MNANTGLGLAVIALLVVGAGIGRASVDPIYVTEKETETIVREVESEPVTETVFVVPQVCIDAVELADQYSVAAGRMVDFVPTLTDAISEARQGVVTADSQQLTRAEQVLRDTDSRVTSQFINVDDLKNQADAALEQCREEVPQ